MADRWDDIIDVSQFSTDDQRTHTALIPAIEANWSAALAWTADRSYYIDPDSGSDSNDGLSESAPVQTWGQIVTLADAYYASNATAKVRIYVKKGTKARVTAGDSAGGPYSTVAIAYFEGKTWQVDTYGTGEDPEITAFVDVSGLSWSNVSGTVYTVTGVDATVGSDGVSWLRSADDTDDANVFRRISADADVDSTALSFRYTATAGGTLRVNTGTLGTPSAASLEAVEDNSGSGAVEGFVFDGDLAGLRVTSGYLIMRGFGCHASNPHDDQTGIIKLGQAGHDLGCVEGLKGFYAGDHLININTGLPQSFTSSQADGQFYVKNCILGLAIDTDGDGTAGCQLVNHYSQNGGHAFIGRNIAARGGRLPHGTNASRGGQVMGGHAGSSNLVDLSYLANVAIEQHPWAPTSYGACGNVPVTTDPTLQRSVVYLATKPDGLQVMDWHGEVGHVFDSVFWELVGSGSGNELGEQFISPKGSHRNLTIIVDSTAKTGGSMALFNRPGNSASVTWIMENCLLGVKGDRPFELNARREVEASGDTWVNCIFAQLEGTGAFVLGVGNEPSHTRCRNNAYWDLNSVTDAIAGYSNHPNAVVLTSAPVVGERPNLSTDLYNGADPDVGPNYDATGELRSATEPTIGPLETLDRTIPIAGRALLLDTSTLVVDFNKPVTLSPGQSHTDLIFSSGSPSSVTFSASRATIMVTGLDVGETVTIPAGWAEDANSNNTASNTLFVFNAQGFAATGLTVSSPATPPALNAAYSPTG